MTIQLSTDIWTQFQGEEVRNLQIRRRRLDYRKRIADLWVTIETPIEWVQISDEYLSEFTVKVGFAEPALFQADVNDSMMLRMAAGWNCAGRFIRSEGKLLVMMCPALLGNGMPPARVAFAPVKQRPSGGPGLLRELMR